VQPRDIIVIGGSVGALTAVTKILRALPARLPAGIFVVIHTAPDAPGLLDKILTKAGPLPATYAVDGEPIRRGHVYVAPPDHHLLIKNGHVRVARGPREHRFRPAVDPLFRTAAAVYGARVVGIILSGGQDDGVLGLAHIEMGGGVTIAQDPDDADAPSMPEHAIREIPIDHVLRADDIAAVVCGLVGAGTKEALVTENIQPPRDSAEEGTDALESADRLAPPSPFTCPDCGGALWEIKEGELIRYQCHVGHRFSGDSLIDAQSDGLETALWTALRALEESSALRRRMAKHARTRGMSAIADAYDEHANDSEARAKVVRRMLVTEPHSKFNASPEG
jgi:two-component system chemotaxis response regulator CheB